MTSLFTPSKKRPRYSLPVHSAALDGDEQLPSNAFPHTLPRSTANGRYSSTATSTPLSLPSHRSPPPPPPAPATPALQLLPSTSHFTPLSSSTLLSPTPTTMAVHSLLSERSSRTTASQLQLLSSQLTAQFEEQMTAVRYQHNSDKVEWKREMADREKNLRLEITQLKWTAEERVRQEEERAAAQRVEDEERERREKEYKRRIDELQAKLTFVATAEQKRRTEHEQLHDERREETARLAEERDRERTELSDMRTQLELLKEKEGKWEQRREDEVKLLRTEVSVLKRRVKEREEGERKQSDRVREVEEELRRREEEERRRAEEERQREEREMEIGGLKASMHARMEEAQEVDRRYRLAVEEVKSLKAQLSNQQLLEEQLRGLDSKLSRIEADRDRLQQQLMEREGESERQEAVMADIGAVVGPVHSVEQVLVAVRALNTTNRSISQQLAALHTQLTQQADELTSRQSQATALQQRIDTLESELMRANQRIATVSMERDSLNKLLKSYDDEDSRAGQHDNSHAMRISALEDTVMRERKEKERVSEEVRAVKAECTRLRKEKEQVEAQLDATKHHSNVSEQLQQEEDDGVKVMHLVDNPEKQRRQQYVRGLEEQVRTLSERMKEVETNQPSSSTTTAAITHSSIVPFTPSLSPIPHTTTPHTTHTHSTTHTAATIAQLESLLSQKAAELSELQSMSDKRYERLQSAFRDKAKEFRDGVYQLCGWRMEQLRSGEWRLRSMYGERESDVLLFVRDEAGRLRLQETELAVRLGKELLSVLTEWQSIPAFISSVTMELLARSTRAG